MPPRPNLTGVDLDFGCDTIGVPASANAVFPFAHDETPNTTGMLPFDDDIVTITTPIVNIDGGDRRLLLQPPGLLDRRRDDVPERVQLARLMSVFSTRTQGARSATKGIRI